MYGLITANLAESLLDIGLSKAVAPAILSLLGMVITWAVGKYVIPWLKTQSVVDKLKYARHIIYLADSITDDWTELKPDSNIAEWFDEKVDELRDAVDDLRGETERDGKLRKTTARTIVKAAVARKKASSLNTEVLDKQDFREIARNGR